MLPGVAQSTLSQSFLSLSEPFLWERKTPPNFSDKLSSGVAVVVVAQEQKSPRDLGKSLGVEWHFNGVATLGEENFLATSNTFVEKKNFLYATLYYWLNAIVKIEE